MPISDHQRVSLRLLLARVTPSHLLTGAASLAAFVLVIGLLHEQGQTRQVLVAAADLSAGSPVTAGSVRGVHLPADIDLVGLVPADQDLAGAVVHRAVAKGVPLRWSDLEVLEGESARQRLSIPVEPERAVGGQLRLLDRVDVITVADDGAQVVASGLRVVDLPVVEPGVGVFGAARGPWFVTVEVDPAEALAVAVAVNAGSVQLARSADHPRAGP